MNCEAINKYLDAFVDGELETGLMLDVENHLTTCDTCNALSQVKTDMKSALQTLGQQTLAPARLRQQVQNLSKKQKPIGLYATIGAVPLAAAAAALIIFTIATPPSQSPGTSDPQLASVVNDVVQRHTQKLPLDIQGPDPSHAASWFSDKVPFSVRTPRIGLENANFQGARVSNVQANQAAQMVYAVDGHRVTLMIFPVEQLNITGGNLTSVNGKKVLVGKRNGYNVAVLFEGNMAYALSSDLPSSRLLSLFKTDRNI